MEHALKELINGEREACNNYTLFAAKAKEENLPIIAKLFNALVTAEMVHIKNHLNALGYEYTAVESTAVPVENTLANIQTALAGELFEYRNLYPKLMKSLAKSNASQKMRVAKLSMTWAQKVEKEHAKLLKIALKNFNKKSIFGKEGFFVCKVCGNIVQGNSAQSECKICGHDPLFFAEVIV